MQLQWLQPGEASSVLLSAGMAQALLAGRVFAAPCLSCKHEQARRSGIPARRAPPLTGTRKRVGNAGTLDLIR